MHLSSSVANKQKAQLAAKLPSGSYSWQDLPLHTQEFHRLPSCQPLKFIPHYFCLKGWEQRRSTIISLSAAETTKKVLNFWWVHHLKSREIRSRQVTQVVFCRSVSSGLFFDQRCCLKEETWFVFGTGNILQPLGNSLEMNCIRVTQFTSCYSTTETLWGVAF